jgi:XTP/dITP diphosphohydrolase
VVDPDDRLVLASANPKKVAELVQLLGHRYRVEPRPSDLADTVEDGDTLEYNATKKATEVSAHTGASALADDTGLFVDGLGGRPGVWTARYAGADATDADNRAKLLVELAAVEDRRAEFRTVIALVEPGSEPRLATGIVTGRIAGSEAGDAGFGYDPLFVPDDGDGRTFAQMTAAEKNEISHRRRAIDALVELLANRTANNQLNDSD